MSDVRRAPLTERRTIYVQPIRANLAGSTPVSQRALGMQAGARHHGQVEAAGDMSTDLLDDMRQYIEAYYDNACPVRGDSIRRHSSHCLSLHHQLYSDLLMGRSKYCRPSR